MHPEPQAVAATLQVKGAHAEVVAAGHEPPLQFAAFVATSAVQDGGRHWIVGNEQTELDPSHEPAHTPDPPQLPERGAPTRFVHVPGELPAHVWHWAPHDVLQHTPSTQLPVAQIEPVAQPIPLPHLVLKRMVSVLAWLSV
jgi:hypothetical protein